MGDVVALSAARERRRWREAEGLHARCRALLVASIAAERAAMVDGPPADRVVHGRRLRAFEDAQSYAATIA